MKKLLFLFLIFPIIAFGQITPGKYKINLASYNLNMELAPGTTIIKVSADCRDRMSGCGAQVWQIVPFFRMPNMYFLQSVGNGQYLTWNIEEPDKLPTLKLRASNRNINSQGFKIIANDRGSYQIQPYSAETAANDYFLGGETQPGSYGYVRLFKRNQIPSNNNSIITWIFNPPVTPLPVQQSTSVVVTPPPSAQTSSRVIVTPPPPPPIQRTSNVVVTPPNNNKLDIDIKTGADNLEVKPFQENVEIRVILKNRPNAILLNANRNQSWPNNSIKRVSVALPADINVEDILEMQIYRLQKREGTPISTIFNNNEVDNWNIDKITTTAKIMVDGQLKTFRFADFISPLGSSHPLFRFTERGGDGRTEGQMFKGSLFNLGSGSTTNSSPSASTMNPVLKIEILTGGDDLRGGNDNLSMLIRLKIRPVRNISLNNINSSQNWGNFSEHTVTKTLNSPPFTFDDIEDILLRHTGGSGIGADNWYLDKLKISLTINGETRILVDKVDAPIHYFKGDSRSKTFLINQ